MNYINFTVRKQKAIDTFKDILDSTKENDKVAIDLTPDEARYLEEAGLIKPNPTQGRISRFFVKEWVVADGSRPNFQILPKPIYYRTNRPAKLP